MDVRFFDFCLHPSRWIHESWQSVLPEYGVAPSLIEILWRRPVFSRVLFEVFELAVTEPDDWDEEAGRIMLEDGAHLESGLLKLGLCFQKETLRRIVDGAALRHLKDDLGEEAFGFVRAGDTASMVPCSGRLPSLGRRRSLMLGCRCFMETFALPDQMRRRVRLKLPACATEETPGQDGYEDALTSFAAHPSGRDSVMSIFGEGA